MINSINIPGTNIVPGIFLRVIHSLNAEIRR